MAKLQDLLQDRHSEIERRTSLERRDLKRLQSVTKIPSIATATKKLFCSAVDIPESAEIGSFVAKVPLPTLLSCGRRLTVDVIPSSLKEFEETYGVTERAFIELAARKAILVNIRDYDPKVSDPDKEKAEKDYAEYTPFMSRLMAEAADSVYFGAALRDDFLDNLPQTPVLGKEVKTRTRLRTIFEGTENLRTAFESVSKEASAMLRFREEKVGITSARWHWAFIESMKFFVSAAHMDGLRQLYDRAVSNGLSSAARVEAIVQIVHTLRFMHLYYTAPLTASFGDTYNVMDNHESYNLYQIAKPAPVEAQVDLGLHSFVDDLYDGNLDDRWTFNKNEDFRYFGVDSYFIRDGRSHSDFYDTSDNVSELASYVVGDGDFKFARNHLRRHLNALLAEPAEYIRRHISDVAMEAASVRGKLAKTLSSVSHSHIGVAAPNEQTRDAFILVDPKAYHARWEAILADGRRHGRSESRGLMLGEAEDYWRNIVVTKKEA